MIATFRRALALLDRRQRRRVFLIMLSSAASAVVQVLSILAIMPFIVLLANPDLLETSQALGALNRLVGADTYRDFLILFGLVAIVVLTLGNLFVAFEEWVSNRFFCNLRLSVQTRLLQRMLRKPYEYFLDRHSATLGDILLRQSERAVDGVVGVFVGVFASTMLAVFIVVLLLVISFKTTLLTLLGLLAAYLTVFLLLRRRMEAHGEELTRLSASTFSAVKETFDGMAEIQTRRAGNWFSGRFEEAAGRMARLEVRYGLMSYLPHLLLEAIVFSGFVAVALWFLFTTDDAGISLSFIALYGIAVYRLVPALKGIFEGMAAIHHNADAVHAVLEHWRDASRAVERRELPRPERSVVLSRVAYRHEGSARRQVDGVDIEIPVGSSACLFGPSGCGKTTLLNVIAGLIFPQEGEVTADGRAITPETVDSWRGMVGYAPQRVYLFADTIAANIAFGAAEPDLARVAEVGRLAALEDVVAALPQGYLTPVAEQGESLSGGQRQRIGIARILYHDPQVLLFDESFTGLDAATRDAVVDALFALPGKTLVFSSHERAIADRCDQVVTLSAGRITL